QRAAAPGAATGAAHGAVTLAGLHPPPDNEGCGEADEARSASEGSRRPSLALRALKDGGCPGDRRMDYPAQRRDRLARHLADEGLDALLLTNPVSVTYLTGFSDDSSVVVLTKGRALLVSDPRYVGQIADECPGLETHIRPAAQKLPEAVVGVL